MHQSPRVVLKFGGTSVADRKNWSNIASILKESIASGEKPLLVCSALSGVSNKLEEIVEKDLLLCELCGAAVAPVDQIRWLIRRLGPLAFANPTVMMVVGRDLGLVDQGVRSADGEVLRNDRLALQCPKCRRKTASAA